MEASQILINTAQRKSLIKLIDEFYNNDGSIKGSVHKQRAERALMGFCDELGLVAFKAPTPTYRKFDDTVLQDAIRYSALLRRINVKPSVHNLARILKKKPAFLEQELRSLGLLNEAGEFNYDRPKNSEIPGLSEEEIDAWIAAEGIDIPSAYLDGTETSPE